MYRDTYHKNKDKLSIGAEQLTNKKKENTQMYKLRSDKQRGRKTDKCKNGRKSEKKKKHL